MPEFIKHRVNRTQDLKTVQPAWGVEIDLRSDVKKNGALHLSHDPWAVGDSFDEWLQEFSRHKIKGPVILNTKEDGLEDVIIEKVKKAGIKNYFFLDTAVPTLIKWVIKKQERCFAARLSKYEKSENLEALRGKLDWLWVDCFDAEPVSPEAVDRFKKDFKLVLVSPELQGAPVQKIEEFRALAQRVDFICTKDPLAWGKTLAR